MRRRLGYLHVPKAAGSSATDALRRSIVAHAEEEIAAGRPAPSVCPQVFDRSLYGRFDDFGSFAEHQRSMVFTDPVDDADHRLARFDAVIGHYSAPSLRVGRADDDVAIVLREPRARLISLYTFWRSWSEAEHAAWGAYDASRYAARLDWPGFLDEATIAPQTDNVAARLLLGAHPSVPLDGFIAAADIAAVTSDALAVLRGLGMVDVVERGDACWRHLAQWSDLSLDIGQRNETTLDAGPTPDWSPQREREAAAPLAARTVVDRALWAAAVRRGDPSDADGLVDRADAIYAVQLDKVRGAVTVQDDRERPYEAPRAAPAWRRAVRRLRGR